MKKFLFVFSIYLIAYLFAFPKLAGAAGLVATGEYAQVAVSAVKALIIYDGEKETLIESFTFNINPLVVESFAWIIPVPEKPEVEKLKVDIFNDLEALTAKGFSKDGFFNKIVYFDVIEEKNIPGEVFSRPVDIFDYKVFGPENSLKDLEEWMHERYAFPKTAYRVLKEYDEKNWYFVALEVNALHIQFSATDSLFVYGAHTYPVKITFDTEEIIYPLKLISIEEDMDSEGIPLSFDYGQPSENVLGEKDEVVDALLTKQSTNKFPRLPLDFMNVKIDLSVLADYKVEVPGFTTIFADRIANKDLDLSLPGENFFLTRMYSYKPKLLLEDVVIEKAGNSKKVNPRVTKLETVIRYATFGGLILGPLGFFFSKKNRVKLPRT